MDLYIYIHSWVPQYSKKIKGKYYTISNRYIQTYGVDYQETFALVAKINTIQVLLSLATNLDWSLHQLDVKNAFLNGDLEEEVYMELPPSFDTKERKRKSLSFKEGTIWSKTVT